MKIQVTQLDIENGVPGTLFCPIALAVNKVVGPRYRARVLTKVILTAMCDATYNPVAEIDLPKLAIKFTRLFDAHGAEAVEPFEFDLDLPNGFVS